MEHAIELIKIDGLRDVGGNQRVVLADLGDAIHLNGENDENAVFFKLAREFNGFRSAPTVAKNNDVCVLLFFTRQRAIAVGIKQVKDCLMGVLATVVLKRLHEYGGSIVLAQALDELDFRVDAIIVADEAADKTNHNDG